ncbi:hypothetical protein [Herbaspirillum sp. alder98]|uniref:hypothetical protein n=1 Tax=Herbaspirillum sp. alder98 TaxID=2913096 RepID=UPI001CD8695B|nr:hypothetical protein [Herbaspirillum sp. alder98]MCA1324572.1 hypothetical protein [Herbaspirillum sp. alder98]
MNITFNTGTGGVSGGNETPSANEVKGFQDGLAGKSDQDLLQGLLQGNLPKWQEQAIKDEMNKRHPEAQQSGGASGTGGGSGSGSSDELDDLVKKLKKGTISDEEIKKLSAISGVPEGELQQEKSKNAADSLGQDSDITGG